MTADIALIASLRRELDEVRRELRDLTDDNVKKTSALRFYLEDDRRSVDAGILETIGMRPAFEALGGAPSRLCSAHQTPSKMCRLCYPSPPRPRVQPAPPRERESRP